MEKRLDVVVVGAGIAGLTAAALLAREGLTVELLAHFGLPLPQATPLDPACVVDLADGRPPVRIWRDPARWKAEREQQFPGSGRFWQLCATLHGANWAFASRDPVLPPRSLWDLGQLLPALRPANLASGLLAAASVADLLTLTGCGADPRLRRFLDLQLRLYSQEPAERTAALYGATMLAMGQAPLGLSHLQGSMQVLSQQLEQALTASGGQLRLRHRVSGLERSNEPGGGAGWRVRGERFERQAADVVLALPVQSLPALLGEQLPAGYRQRLAQLPDPSGALVFYGAVERVLLPANCPAHLQLDWADPGTLFVSVSHEGDGRAPAGLATVIASVFTPAKPWFGLEATAYEQAKAETLAAMQRGLESLLGISPEKWRHAELATPRGFERWTGRPFGFVGGLGQHPSRFGPFGLASRTPLPGLWLCGDSIHPGEGTAAVGLSALMACRQLLAERGQTLNLSALNT